MASIRFIRGDITRDTSDCLVNTVNCVGVMGAGVARAFITAWPQIATPYVAACRSGDIVPGSSILFRLPDGRLWAALATKKHWRDPSQLSWVRNGLADLAHRASLAGVCTIAIPRPGCGLGGLSWDDVRPMLEQSLADFDVTVYL